MIYRTRETAEKARASSGAICPVLEFPTWFDGEPRCVASPTIVHQPDTFVFLLWHRSGVFELGFRRVGMSARYEPDPAVTAETALLVWDLDDDETSEVAA